MAPVTDQQRRCLLSCFLAAHPVGIADAMVAGHEMIGDGVGVGVDNRGRDAARHVSTFTIIPMVFNQCIGYLFHQLAFHLTDDGGRDEARFGELQFQIDGIEHRVAPLQGLFPDVFGGLLGVVGRDFLRLNAGRDAINRVSTNSDHFITSFCFLQYQINVNFAVT